MDDYLFVLFFFRLRDTFSSVVNEKGGNREMFLYSCISFRICDKFSITLYNIPWKREKPISSDILQPFLYIYVHALSPFS